MSIIKVKKWTDGPNLELNLTTPTDPLGARRKSLNGQLSKLNGPLATVQMCDTFNISVMQAIYYTDYKYAKMLR